MEIKSGQIFNLWDTNGRRADVINALTIYLRILNDLNNEYPDEEWSDTYPAGLKQYRFYTSAIDESPEVFQKHDKFDEFEEQIHSKKNLFLNRRLSLSNSQKKELDTSIEARARHYTSNLVRLGLADEDRRLTPVGFDFLNGKIHRDEIEEMLPLSDLNIALLRQLMKFRVYTTADSNGYRTYYSPFFMACYLLLNGKSIDKDVFKYVVQGTSPYWITKNTTPNKILSACMSARGYVKATDTVPSAFQKNGLVSWDDFCAHIKNRKQSSVVQLYYQFYKLLYAYRIDPTDANYNQLRKLLQGKDSDKFKKAFGRGDTVFHMGTVSSPYSHTQFKRENATHPLLTKAVNPEFYVCYDESKYIDTAQEYSDTTMRLLSATGLFRFGKALPELAHIDVLKSMFEGFSWEDKIFGVVPSREYEKDALQFISRKSISEIVGLSATEQQQTVVSIASKFGVSGTDLKESLKNQNRKALELHIQEKYPKTKILELLRLFSDRRKDKEIKESVNADATVPTIYEYVVAIAWYYISGELISVYDSLNLTLNGDLDPVVHAAGGAGDIVVEYDDKVVMLEVTLMNKAAQKRGEWEPVLRHSINLKAETPDKDVTTIFVADELDHNTINIWRAVSSVPLESTSTGKITDHVVIMPFTNEELCVFIERGIDDTAILQAIRASYNEIDNSFDNNWRNKLLKDIA